MFLSAAGAGGGGPTDVDDVFSTYLYDGTGSNLTITNGIDLSGEGGLVWFKQRNATRDHGLFDTARGQGKYLVANDINVEATTTTMLTAFNSNGFTLGGGGAIVNNGSGTYVSWTFRKAKKFFDVVTWTGNGVNGRTISHNLGSTPGMILVKSTSGSDGWITYHRGMDASSPQNYAMFMNLTGGRTTETYWNNTAPTSTGFTVSNNVKLNGGSGQTYVAYLFAHNDGDGEFGPDGDQDIIKCGSYTGNSADARTIDLGFEASWILVKRQDGATDWWIVDDMRGLFARQQTGRYLEANTANSDANQGKFWADSQGFAVDAGDYNTGGENYIYMAIRRGSLNIPENATDVFDVDQYTGGQAVNTKFNSAGFPADMLIHLHKIDNVENNLATKLLDKLLVPNSTAAAANTDYASWENNNGWVTGESTAGNTWRLASGANNHIVYAWKRAPSYFDVVSYIGTGSNRTVTHNLGVAPEMMWIKALISGGYDWMVYHKDVPSPNSKMLKLNETGVGIDRTALLNNTAPAATQFTVGTDVLTNNNTTRYIAYLFATAPGVSKVGSYTGTGSDQNIDCGFSSGARFVLIKNASASDNWPIFDSTRGIVAGNDFHLSLNNPHNEANNADYIDPHSSGFAVVGNDIMVNASGNTYIFYAIA